MNQIQHIIARAKSQKSAFWKTALSRDITMPGNPVKLSRHEKAALCFLSINSPNELRQALTRDSFHALQNQINYPGYTHHQITKKSGGKRNIYEPSPELKKIQKRLNYYLQGYYLLIKPKEVHGFVINPSYLETQSNIVENAKPHINKKVILNIDLQDFFPSITSRMVKKLFDSSFFDFDNQIATALTLLTTFEGKLPIGAPTSPVISNFVCAQLDQDLREFSALNLLTYTRYADDLTFSGNNAITKGMISEINSIIQKNHFKMNEKKLRIRTNNRQQIVTGLTVNEKVNVDRKLLKKVRAMIFDLEKNGVSIAAQKHFKLNAPSEELSISFLNRLEGYVNFIGQVRGSEDRVYLRYDRLFSPVIF